MKKVFRGNEIRLIVGLVLAGLLCVACAVKAPKKDIVLNGADNREEAPLVLQALDYTENPVDIRNPDRGFYIAGEYVIPVDSGTPGLPDLRTSIRGTTVFVDAGIVYMEFDLRNFSSNAPLNGKPIGPWSAVGSLPPDYGTTQPLTPAALNYVRAALQKVRESEAVAIVKFNYDGQGHTYVDNESYDQIIHDCEPGAPKGRVWYETGVI